MPLTRPFKETVMKMMKDSDYRKGVLEEVIDLSSEGDKKTAAKMGQDVLNYIEARDNEMMAQEVQESTDRLSEIYEWSESNQNNHNEDISSSAKLYLLACQLVGFDAPSEWDNMQSGYVWEASVRIRNTVGNEIIKIIDSIEWE